MSTFIAEVKEVKALKTVSNDRVCRLVLITDDVRIMELAAIPTDKTVVVNVEVQE